MQKKRQFFPEFEVTEISMEKPVLGRFLAEEGQNGCEEGFEDGWVEEGMQVGFSSQLHISICLHLRFNQSIP